MALDVHVLSVPYHAQTEDFYCGPACAQMVLANAELPISDQPSLYESVCNTPDSNWWTNPNGLAITLSQRSETALEATYKAQPFDDQLAATHTISWTIYRHGRPPIALVNGKKHWVVVTGCILSGPPNGAYSVIALVFQDPDDTSAEGGGGTSQIELVTYEQWIADLFKDKVFIAGDDFNKKWVVVGAVDAPDVTLQEPAPLAGIVGPVDADRAVEAAREGVRQEYVQAVDPIKMALDGTAPREAFPVARQGRQDHSYYIVPFYDQDDRIPAAVLIDAGTGAFLGVRAIPGGSLAYAFGGALLSRDGFLGNYRDGIPDPGTGERRSLDNATFSDTPEWEPSAQSSSPYLPFWRVRYDGDQPYDLYVRLDGQVFTELTEAYG